MARSDFGMGLEIRRRERIQVIAETLDSRADIWLVIEATQIVERLRSPLRNVGGDGLCGNDSLNAR